MFKIAGSIMIITATVFVFNKKTFTYYYTYKFLKYIIETIKFNYKNDMEYYSKNIFIKNQIIYEVKDFFENIGKRDRNSERQYIKNYIDIFNSKYIEYLNKYNEIQRTNLIYGIAFGTVIIILII